MTIKERCGIRCIIREDNYGSKMGKFKRLVELALADFPNLNPDEIEIVHYGGDRIARTFGIEFLIAEETEIPASYEMLVCLHPSL